MLCAGAHQGKDIENCLPELSQNLAITLQALNTRKRTQDGGGAIEPAVQPDRGKL